MKYVDGTSADGFFVNPSLMRLGWDQRSGYGYNLGAQVRSGFSNAKITVAQALPSSFTYIGNSWSDGNHQLQRDGSSIGTDSTSYTIPVGLTNIQIGYKWGGSVSEVRLSQIQRTNAWLDATLSLCSRPARSLMRARRDATLSNTVTASADETDVDSGGLIAEFSITGDTQFPMMARLQRPAKT